MIARSPRTRSRPAGPARVIDGVAPTDGKRVRVIAPGRFHGCEAIVLKHFRDKRPCAAPASEDRIGGYRVKLDTIPVEWLDANQVQVIEDAPPPRKR